MSPLCYLDEEGYPRAVPICLLLLPDGGQHAPVQSEVQSRTSSVVHVTAAATVAGDPVCVCVCVCVEGGGDEGGGKSTSGGGIRGKGQRERAYFELVDSSKSVEGRYWQQPLQ